MTAREANTWIIRPHSDVIIQFLAVMMKHSYIGEFETIDDHRAVKVVVNLMGRLVQRYQPQI